MKLPVYLYGQPVLRSRCRAVDTDSADRDALSRLVSDMFETMYSSEGVGLAAPQIGRDEQIVVIDADPVAESFPECAGRRFVLINPTVEVLDGEPVSRSEGCLSLPGLSEDVRRVEHIRLSWTDENLQPRSEEINGFLARIVQHECDHLDGKLYIDHISPIRKQLIKRKLMNIVEGRTRCDYPVRYAKK